MKKTKITKRRSENPHVSVRNGASALLYLSNVHDGDHYYEWMASLLLSAFAFEGYLNVIGPMFFPSWDDLERLRWETKTKLIADEIGLDLKKEEDPFRTIKRLFSFRNSIAHRKSKEHEEIYYEDPDKLAPQCYQPLKTPDEKFCTFENAKLCIEKVDEMMLVLYKLGKIKFDSKCKTRVQRNAFLVCSPIYQGDVFNYSQLTIAFCA